MPSPLVRTKLYVPRARHVVVPRSRLTDHLDARVAAPAHARRRTRRVRQDDPAWRRGPGRRAAPWRGCRSRRASSSPRRSGPTSSPPSTPPRRAWAPACCPCCRPRTRRWSRSSRPCSTSSRPCPTASTSSSTTTTSPTGPRSPATSPSSSSTCPLRCTSSISTRADPALPLARLRARGELVEVRAADLRFTVEEATAYLNDVVGLDLDDPEIAMLEGRTEGWIAALQLAALSLQGRDDAAHFIAGFAGDDRYVVDYLVEEVLGRQPDAVRRFLLDTSILDRLSASALRRRDRCGQRQGDARVARALEPLRHPPRRQPPVVPLPPPLRRRPPRPPRSRSGRARSPDCTGGPPSRMPCRPSRCPPSGTRSLPGTSSWPPTSWSARSSGCCAGGTRRRSAGGSTRSPTRWCTAGRCSRSASSGR